MLEQDWWAQVLFFTYHHEANTTKCRMSRDTYALQYLSACDSEFGMPYSGDKELLIKFHSFLIMWSIFWYWG